MFIIAALGNPGDKYTQTRHNAGWILLDEILGAVEWQTSKHARALYHKDSIGSVLVEYLKPQTFMNESGISVRYARDKHEVSHDHIVVLYDDIDLPLGKIRISHDRGDGGHNGIKSLAAHLGGTDFTRIRIGIAKTLEDGSMVKPNVLGNFENKELETLLALAPKVEKVIEVIVNDGVEKAMSTVQ